MSNEEIRIKVNKVDETAWLEELKEKSTLTLYKQHKRAVREYIEIYAVNSSRDQHTTLELEEEIHT